MVYSYNAGLLDIGIVFSAIVMYSFVMSDQIEKELSYQREIADQRAGIMVFTAVASMEPITFLAELEHTRAYLAVEQAQYEDSLFVDFNTPHTLFRVPL